MPASIPVSVETPILAPLRRLLALLVLPGTALLAAVAPARAVLDIEDRGPALDVGQYALRITNIGVLGNAFFNKGLSNDASWEYPRGSGHEALEHAELWVGGRRADGKRVVSGGPMLEFRPTLATTDRVRVGLAGGPGTRGVFDDDGDGRIDEEALDGLDDDGDGEVDEDVFMPSQQIAEASFVDDRPEAITYGFPNGERHEPLGLSVRQQAFAWSSYGNQKVAGVQWTITNHSADVVNDVWVGLSADLDSRERARSGGQVDDAVGWLGDTLSIFEGTSTLNTLWIKQCYATLAGRTPYVHDARRQDLPYSAVVGLSHTTDPLSFIDNFAFTGAREAKAAARAPARDTAFRYTILANDLPQRQGGPPTLDLDRYEALQGLYPGAATEYPHDYAVLVSAGPFPHLDPGQSVEFAVAFVVAESPDSLLAAIQAARLLWRGTRLNLIPDTGRLGSHGQGDTGINGYETPYEAPPGLEFYWDRNCNHKFRDDPAYRSVNNFQPDGGPEVLYQHGKVIWTDWDCDACTGLDGKETQFHWYAGQPAPPQPATRVLALDHQVSIQWDDYPEVLADGGVIPGSGWRFGGYRLYRLSDWKRDALFPPSSRWQMLAAFARNSANGGTLLSAITDTTVIDDYILYGQKHHPIGRYRFTDTNVSDGFDYHYGITAYAERTVSTNNIPRTETLESPIRLVFSDVVRPRTEARADASAVRVVPNPYRGSSPWDRPAVAGDVFTRHIDFVGLPRATSTIKVWTLAGDFVVQLDHDGRNGDGQAAWNLISRNGQDVASGVYLFTVDSSLGRTTGRFVLIR